MIEYPLSIVMQWLADFLLPMTRDLDYGYAGGYVRYRVWGDANVDKVGADMTAPWVSMMMDKADD